MDIKKDISIITKLVALMAGLLMGVFVIGGIALFKPELLDFSEPDPALWKPRNIKTDLAGHPKESLIRMGHEVLTKSPELIGPLAGKVEKQYAGNLLTCQSCHLDGGTKPGAGSFAGVANRFP